MPDKLYNDCGDADQNDDHFEAKTLCHSLRLWPSC